MQKITKQFLKKLPKTDLHCHLDGSMRLETILDLAEKQKIKLPANDPDSLRKLVVISDKCENLSDYLKAFDITLKVLQKREGLYRAAYELVEDAAKENVKYIEVRYSPILHVKKGLKLTQILDSVIEGLRDASKKYKVKTGVIICGMRHINPESSVVLAELAVEYKNRGVVGFDLAGAEQDYPAKLHKEAFYKIVDNNINTTVHAGEAYGPESIHQALHYCDAHRIGHGTRLKEDVDLMNYINDHRIPIEVCLTSNVQTKACTDFKSHPLRFYYDYGLRVTINTDNRLVSDTTVTEEFYRAHKYLNFTLNEIKDLIVFGFKSAFLPYQEKVEFIHQAIKELREFKDSDTPEREWINY